MAERVQKVLAGAGHGSRRKVEKWIREGRLQIDGRTAQLGDIVRGASLVVWAIRDGRDCADAILDSLNSAQSIAAE